MYLNAIILSYKDVITKSLKSFGVVHLAFVSLKQMIIMKLFPIFLDIY